MELCGLSGLFGEKLCGLSGRKLCGLSVEKSSNLWTACGTYRGSVGIGGFDGATINAPLASL